MYMYAYTYIRTRQKCEKNVQYTHVRTVVSGVRDHNIRVGRQAVIRRGVRLVNNFHPMVQLRPTARLRKRKRV